MFHFARRRIEAHVCICFVAQKVYSEQERLLGLSIINMSVDKVLALALAIYTDDITQQQADYQQDNAEEKASMNRCFI